MRLEVATVLITGASGGIGQALAEAFSARGATVVVSGRRSDELAGLAERTGGRAITADLAERDDVARLVIEAGPVDVLVANAALPASGHLLDFTPEEVDRALEVNLRAPVALTRALVGPMVERHRGHLVFVSSLSGMVASPGSSLYSATKFALRGFAHGLAQDLRPAGVGVSLVLPGFIRDAGMFADAGVALPPGVGTRSPADVARATVRAVERNQMEVVVAPPALNLAARLGASAPGVAARVQRLGGAERTAAALAKGQRNKR
ncbi:MAG: SDR family NAD(P)-dependent oxidoreductase [Acidimicrobiales bacterium]